MVAPRDQWIKTRVLSIGVTVDAQVSARLVSDAQVGAFRFVRGSRSSAPSGSAAFGF
jgi:hypothetical protein